MLLTFCGHADGTLFSLKLWDIFYYGHLCYEVLHMSWDPTKGLVLTIPHAILLQIHR